MKNATLIAAGSTLEAQFTAPWDVSYEDQYTIHWNGSGVLQNFYAPNGLDILQLGKTNVYGAFSWGFVYFTFNPSNLASSYSFNPQGLWRIVMKITDPTVPSLHVLDDYRVSIHRFEYAYATITIPVGGSYAASLPSIPGWHNGAVYSFYLNDTSTKLDVSNSLLQSSYSYDSYAYSYWWPYNQTVQIRNLWTAPIYLQLSERVEVFRPISYARNEQGLTFNVDSTVFDSMMAGYYSSLDITGEISPTSTRLLTPNGEETKSLHRIINYTSNGIPCSDFCTLEAVYGNYKVSMNPYSAWRVLENNVYGTWRFFATLNHSICVLDVDASKSIVGCGCTVDLNVTLQNRGSFAETFNVTAECNMTTFNRQLVTLAGGDVTVVTLTWNTTGFAYGNYSLRACAQPVPGETDTADNNLTGGWVIVGMVGDITGASGYPDSRVDMRDVSYVARRFMCKPGDSLWDPNGDVNGDGKTNMLDIGTVAKHFGEHYP